MVDEKYRIRHTRCTTTLFISSRLHTHTHTNSSSDAIIETLFSNTSSVIHLENYSVIKVCDFAIIYMNTGSTAK